MTDTQKRIEAYQNLLPGLQEKVVAVAFLLALSVIMLTSASFAWLTISRAPEVSAVTTNIASNGNLEIALATGDGTTEPGESKVGDSMAAAEGQNIVVNANKTWGNLINLSDPSYGLNNLVLRPAQLGAGNLNEYPLSAAVYNTEGRIIDMKSNFNYAKWNPGGPGINPYFELTDQFGVRAITSTKYANVSGFAYEFQLMIDDAVSQNSSAQGTYAEVGNKTNMDTLGKMVGIYASAVIEEKFSGEPSKPTISESDLEDLLGIYDKFLLAFDYEAQAIAETINLQYYKKTKEKDATTYTGSQIYEFTEENIAKLNEDGIEIIELQEFIDDHVTVKTDRNFIEDLYEKSKTETVYFSAIEPCVFKLIDRETCEINGDLIDTFVSNAMNDIMGTLRNDFYVVIKGGALKNFENRTGQRLNAETTIPITEPITLNKKAFISTDAEECYFNDDIEYAKTHNFSGDEGENDPLEGMTEIAEDTFGLAIDLWVRTNAKDSYLILEGEPEFDEGTEVTLTTKDANGKTKDVYYVTRNQTVQLPGGGTQEIATEVLIYQSTSMLWYDYENQETEIVLESGEVPEKTEDTGTVDNQTVVIYTLTRDETVYKLYQAEKPVWLDKDTHVRFVLAEDDEPILKKTMIYNVIGYEGENRVSGEWDEDIALSISGQRLTTQGSGSCYVYYADNPEDQAKSLELLKSMEVAFVDGQGQLITTAYMDTENAYEDSGRVTVPLVLATTSNTIETEDGEKKTVITALEQNTATRITAIVYLNGKNLENKDVLAVGDIQGQLNIQFGSTEALVPMEDETLKNATVSVSAGIIGKTEFSYDSGEDLTTSVRVIVDASKEPKSVTAFFLRSINGTQGTREEQIEFTKDNEGNWVGSYTFDAPGKYILRTVQVDGIEYVLKNAPEVTVTGFTVEELFCDNFNGRDLVIMTAENSQKVDLNLKFLTDDPEKLPNTVQGRFLKSDGSAVNVDFRYTGDDHAGGTGYWKGSANFTTSGEYKLEYLVLNGEHTGLDADKHISVNLRLGMRVSVETTLANKSFKLVEDDMTEEQKHIEMRVKVMDDTGTQLRGLTGATLYYRTSRIDVGLLDAPLTWNGEYYVGHLLSLSGTFGRWEFSHVNVEGNNLTRSEGATPVFTFMSPEPPEYVNNTTPTSQYSGKNDAYMNVFVSNSDAAYIEAYIIKDDAEEGEWVSPEDYDAAETGSTNKEWRFLIPKSGGSQAEGTWRLTKLRAQDVFDESGKEYPYKENGDTEDYLYIDFTEEIATNTYREATLTISEKTKNIDGDFSGVFLQTHKIEAGDLEISIKNIYEEALKYSDNTNVVSEVKFTFDYVQGSSQEQEYGGYTNDELGVDGDVETITVTLTSTDGKTFSNAGPCVFTYAGKYVATLSYKVNGDPVSYQSSKEGGLNDWLPDITVSSVKPTVTIEEVKPIGEHYTTDTSAGSIDDAKVQVESKIDGNTITVFAETELSNRNMSVKTYPQVTLKLNNIGNASEAYMIFYSGNAATNELYVLERFYETDRFTWTNESISCMRYVGEFAAGSCFSGYKYNPAGTLRASVIVLKHNDIEYIVNTDEIVIINNGP